MGSKSGSKRKREQLAAARTKNIVVLGEVCSHTSCNCRGKNFFFLVCIAAQTVLQQTDSALPDSGNLAYDSAQEIPGLAMEDTHEVEQVIIEWKTH